MAARSCADPHLLDGHALFEATARDAHERDAVPVLGIHVRLDLEHEARERVVGGVDGHDVAEGASTRVDAAHRAGSRGGAQADEAIEKGLDAEVRHGRTKEHRRHLAGEEVVDVEGVAGVVEQGQFRLELGHVALADLLDEVGIVDGDGLHGRFFGTALDAFELEERTVFAGVDAGEAFAHAERPRQWRTGDAEHLFDLVKEVQG